MHFLGVICTTSHLYEIGKGASLKKFKVSKTFCEQARVFDFFKYKFCTTAKKKKKKGQEMKEAGKQWHRLAKATIIQAVELDTYSAFVHDVVDAREKALVIIYNGKSTDNLDSL